MVSCLTSQFLLSISITPSSLADVTLILEESSYTVDEGDGVATVCAKLIEGVLQTNVSVILSTIDISAVGESIAYICSCLNTPLIQKTTLLSPCMYVSQEVHFRHSLLACRPR